MNRISMILTTLLIATSPAFAIKPHLNSCVPHTAQNTTQVAQRAESSAEKEWNFIVYIAGNNNLHKFILRNVRQMLAVGSTPYINILVHMEQWGHRKTTRYYIEKDNAVIVDNYDTTQQTATGNPESLYDTVKWATDNYPAKKTALVLWNHGAGILDPHIWGRLLNTDRDNLYVMNTQTCLLELDRHTLPKGIAFNDTFETYISNEELKKTLDRICHDLLGGKKIDIVATDACFMCMAEVGSQIKSSTKIHVGSQEAEPGPGWNYQHCLTPFLKHSLTPEEFATQIVQGYEKEYHNLLSDYTQSAFKLKKIDALEKNISKVSNVLIRLLRTEHKKKIADHIRTLRNSSDYTTTFLNCSYIDLIHLYKSFLVFSEKFNLDETTKELTVQLQAHLQEGLKTLDEMLIENRSGPYFKDSKGKQKANGISIYFPTRSIHSSYLKTVFAQSTTWVDFVAEYLKTSRRRLADVFSDDTDS